MHAVDQATDSAETDRHSIAKKENSSAPQAYGQNVQKFKIFILPRFSRFGT